MNANREELIASLVVAVFSLAYLIYAFFVPLIEILSSGAFLQRGNEFCGKEENSGEKD